MTRVELCENGAEWDGYVAAHPRSSSYHRWVWKGVIEKVYGHVGHYFVARSEDGVQGVLPLFEIRSYLFGHFLLSMPFVSYGGTLTNNAEARQALADAAIQTAREIRADHIELRQSENIGAPWSALASKVLMRVALPATSSEMFQSLSSRLRNKIRSAKRQGLTATWNSADGLRDFYDIFSRNMRNLGTPVYPSRWFEEYMAAVPSESHILTIWDGHKAVAATLTAGYGDTLELPWIASTPEARKKYSSVLLYWTALEWAIEQGFRHVDLGRCTPGGGTYQFKQQWTCEEIPLSWQFWTREGADIPQMHADSPKFRFAVEMWKRLPLAVANILGPRIVRALP